LDHWGPCNTALEYYTAIAEQCLDLTADGQVHVDYPKEAFLFLQYPRYSCTHIV
jgi:hypothetical protein